MEKNSSLVKRLLHSGELFQPIYFTQDEAYQFLTELEIYEEAGIKCRIPNWWTKSNRQTSLSLKVKDQTSFGKDALLRLQPLINMGELEITYKELQEFLKYNKGLRLFKGKWIEVDHEKIKKLLEDYKDLESKVDQGLSLNETLRLSIDHSDLVDVDYILGYFKKKVKDLKTHKADDLPDSFQAQLRPY